MTLRHKILALTFGVVRRAICGATRCLPQTIIFEQMASNFQHLFSRLGMSVTAQGGSGRQYVTGPGRNISKYRFVLLKVYRFREI